MKKLVYITAVLTLCSFVMSVTFKVLSLMGAPTLLLMSGIFLCLFIVSLSIYKFKSNEAV